MKKYLITGATGFIGSCLVRQLQADNCHLSLLVRNPIPSAPRVEAFRWELVRGEIPPRALEGVDGVFHLAGLAHADSATIYRSVYRQINVVGTERLLEQAVASGCQKFVYLSSVQAVDNGSEVYCDEDCGVPASSAYGQSKYDAEKIVAQYSYRMSTCILRPSLVYGVGVKGNLLQMIDRIHRRRFPPIPEFGGRRSMVCVEDVVDAAVMAMEDTRADDQTYILADGVDYTARRLYEAITNAFGYPLSPWTLPAPLFRSGAKFGDFVEGITGRKWLMNSTILDKLAGNALYSAAKIRRDLGWTPRYTFYDQVADIVRAYQDEQ